MRYSFGSGALLPSQDKRPGSTASHSGENVVRDRCEAVRRELSIRVPESPVPVILAVA